MLSAALIMVGWSVGRAQTAVADFEVVLPELRTAALQDGHYR
jgi:hypothetical protein